jgi:hypothetical protein
MLGRRILLVFGVGLSLAGLAIVVDPGLAADIKIPDIPRVVVAAFAALLGYVAFYARRQTEFRDASDDASRNDNLEDRFEPPRPGAEIDAELQEGASPRSTSAPSVRVRDRLKQLTIQVLQDAEGVSEREAEEQLETGEWTDDQTAAAFFAEDISPPPSELVGSIMGYESAFERKASHVVGELDRIAGTRTEGN